MLGSEDQILAYMSQFQTADLLESYDSICAQVDQFPIKEEASLARILLTLGFGRLAIAEGNKLVDQPLPEENENEKM